MPTSWINSLIRELPCSQKDKRFFLPRACLVGVGSDLRGDDSAGLMVVRQLFKHSHAENLLIIEGGPAPENVTGQIRAFHPDNVILIDAAHMDEPPGTVQWIPLDSIDGMSASSGTPAILICPSDPFATQNYNSTSYAYSASFYQLPETVDQLRIRNLILSLNAPGAGALTATVTSGMVAEPSRKGMVAEWSNAHDHGAKVIGFWGTLRPGLVPGLDRWEGGRTMLFADLHAASVKAGRQTPSAEDCPDINLTPNGIFGVDLK